MMMKMDDRGETLVESLISIVLLGIVGLAVLSAVGLSIGASGFYKNQAQSSVALREWAERLSAYPYQDCRTGTVWKTAVPVPAGLTVSVSVKYLSGSAFVSVCPSTDQGVQLLSLQVESPGSTVTSSTQQLDVAVRRP